MLAEDHNAVRQAIVEMLNKQKNFEVSGQAENGKVLLDLVQNGEPDIAILDIDMPIMDGRVALSILQDKHPNVKVIMFSYHQETLMICDSLLKGACGYLSKGCNLEEIFETINRVYTDGFFFNGSISKNVILDFMKTDKTLLHNILTEREINVLRLFCDSKLLKEIADSLEISVNTVKFHMKNIHLKTEMSTTQKLMKFAIKNLIAELD